VEDSAFALWVYVDSVLFLRQHVVYQQHLVSDNRCRSPTIQLRVARGLLATTALDMQRLVWNCPHVNALKSVRVCCWDWPCFAFAGCKFSIVCCELFVDAGSQNMILFRLRSRKRRRWCSQVVHIVSVENLGCHFSFVAKHCNVPLYFLQTYEKRSVGILLRECSFFLAISSKVAEV